MAGKKKQIKTVAVFCGSRPGNLPVFMEHAKELGALLAKAGYKITYGGGNAGLMGAVSSAAIANGGEVRGVITKAFRETAWYVPTPGVQEEVVPGHGRLALARRKNKLLDVDAVLILPGGWGTIDEQGNAAAILDMEICAARMSYLQPIIVLNTNNVFYHLKQQMRHLRDLSFIHPGRQNLVKSVRTPLDVMTELKVWNEKGLMRACDLTPDEHDAAPIDETAPKQRQMLFPFMPC